LGWRRHVVILRSTVFNFDTVQSGGPLCFKVCCCLEIESVMIRLMFLTHPQNDTVSHLPEERHSFTPTRGTTQLHTYSRNDTVSHLPAEWHSFTPTRGTTQFHTYPRNDTVSHPGPYF
jgi:hypothetical protein